MPEPPIVERPLFFLDYDGTLAPIVDDPSEAHPHPDVPPLLDVLRETNPLYVVTGRYLRDLASFFSLPLDAVGLHGIQRGRIGKQVSETLSEEARESIDRYRKSVPEVHGIRIEEKGPLFAVHYRLAGDKDAARAAIREWLGDVPPVLDPIWGKDVVELRPRDISKGTVVREIARGHPDRTPVYLGDDVTDEDAFKALENGAVTVKVGAGETAAKFRLGSVEDVVQYLRRYVSS